MTSELFSSIFLLLLLLDPLGNMPFLLSLLRGVPRKRHPPIILRECLFATLLMIIFLFIGEKLLQLMHLSNSALEIAGGLILFLIALRMVFPPLNTPNTADEAPSGEPFIVPLAIPMIAGPAALATILLASKQSEHTITWVLAIIIAGAINTLLLLASGWFARLFGKIGMEALERLMGLILTAMAVQMLIGGIHMAFNFTTPPLTP